MNGLQLVCSENALGIFLMYFMFTNKQVVGYLLNIILFLLSFLAFAFVLSAAVSKI